MNSLNHYTNGRILDRITSRETFAEFGIDPDFDIECEELERQFAELRLFFNHS